MIIIGILILIGVLLLIVELLLTPGFIVGLVGLGFMGAGVFLSYQDYGTETGTIVMIATIVVSVVTVIISLRSGVWERASQKGILKGKVGVYPVEKLKVGQTGESLSAMRPMGTALFDDIKISVSTLGEGIDAHKPIEIIKIQGNKVYVKSLQN